MGKGASTEQVVREIQRRTRRRFSAEEKVRIVLEGLREENTRLKQALAETVLENRLLKKSVTDSGSEDDTCG